jgi:hypothetical protein
MAQADSKPTPSRRQAMVLTAAFAALPATPKAVLANDLRTEGQVFRAIEKPRHQGLLVVA